MRELALAEQHLRAGRLNEAATGCQAFLHAHPGHPDALNLLAVICAQTGATGRALELAEQAIAARPRDPRYRFNRALIREAAGDDLGAEADYRAAVEGDGANLPAGINLGNLLLRTDRLREAEACFAGTVAAFPNAAEAHEGLGVALRHQGRDDDALAALAHALALSPRHPRIEANLAWALFEADRPADAARHFERALAAAPEFADLWAGLAAAHIRRTAWTDALAALDRALALAPGHTRALAFKGVVLDALGRSGERRGLIDLDRILWQRQFAAAPEGYADLGAFNRALAEHVLAHPTLVHDRPTKTTRNGGQTDGLLDSNPGPVAALERWMRAAVAAYVEHAAATAMPAILRTPPQRWRLRVWATALAAGGYQDPHNHPSGWISGVYYVQVPPTIGDTDPDQAGWIEFGRPDPFLRPTVVPDLRTLRPREGLMLMFPSYVWHRTIPYVGDRPRISIAFDVVPLSGAA